MKRENMSWRMTKDEFEKKELELILSDIEEISENLDTLYKDESTRANIKKNIKYFNYKIETMKEFDLEVGRKIVSSNIKKWAEVSEKFDDLDDIMVRVLMTNLNGCNCICFAFLSNNPNITQEFVKDVEYINSGMFSFDDWDNKHVDAILDALNNIKEESPANNKKMLKLYDKNDIKIGLKYKLNWDDISRLFLDKDFDKKYNNLISHSRSYFKVREDEKSEEEEA